MTRLQKQRLQVLLSMVVVVIGCLLCIWFTFSYMEVLFKNLSGGNYSQWNLIIIFLKMATGI